MNVSELINKLEIEKQLNKDEWVYLFTHEAKIDTEDLFKRARTITDKTYGRDIYIRGLIEISNYCKNDCYYCGIRKSNKCASRYRLSKEDILACCKVGYSLGFRTFVMQGGEDMYFTDAKMCEIISAIKKDYPDCAVTLSIGEKKRESYEAYYKAGADRFLLRHETANNEHYRKLHPEELSLENRKRCLRDLKDIGFQTGSGFMVGSPGQTPETLADDFMFLKELDPQMVGIGPFIPHHDTPLKDEKPGTMERTLICISLLRLMLPKALLPATTALGTIHPEGREKGIMAGANVVMPNLSPEDARVRYELYDNKLHSGAEAAESLNILKERMKKIGFTVKIDRGDFKK